MGDYYLLKFVESQRVGYALGVTVISQPTIADEVTSFEPQQAQHRLKAH